MARILFYDFWEKNPKRKPLAKMRSLEQIQIIEDKKNRLLESNFENQMIMLNGSKYRIIHIDKKFKEHSITKHHITNNEITYEVLVEIINN